MQHPLRRLATLIALGAAASLLAACGGGYDDDEYGDGPGDGDFHLSSFLGTTGVFAAWAESRRGTYAAASVGTYAGKRQSLRGSVDFTTGDDLGQAAGIEVYKGSDGHIHALDLASDGDPASQQLSSESAATVDDTCSLSGAQVAGANVDYAGVYFAADLQQPTHSSYFYRLPGADGVCDSADDVVHLVKTGMSPSDAPLPVSAMPVATVRTAGGGIAGFVVKRGAQLVRVDANFANPVVLGTFGAPIGVAVALPTGTTQGYPGGQLFVVDGAIVYVDYAQATTSAALFSIPNWTPASLGAIFAASPGQLFFAVNVAASGGTPASARIYAMPADGSAPASQVAADTARIDSLSVPIGSTKLLWGDAAATYAIRAMPQSGGTPVTLESGGANAGTFVATATAVYYTTWTTSTNATTHVVTRSATSSGIVGTDGTVIQAPLANSSFASGGEQFPWPDDTTTTTTPYETVLQVRGLTPVSVTNPANGIPYVVDGVSGGSLFAIDTATNQGGDSLGTLPTSGAAYLSGSFRDAGHTGFIEAYNPASTNDPATRDLYLFNTREPGTLTRITHAL